MKPSIRKAREIFESLYADENGYLLSTRARRKLQIQDTSLTYGEVSFESFKKILQVVKPQKGEVFYDLGSGNGKAVILASLLAPFSKLVGIEILKELVGASNKILLRYKKIVKKAFPEKAEQEIKFINRDFLKEDISEADVVFAHSTCFSDELMKELTRKLEGLRKGARVVTVTKELKSSFFKPIKFETLRLSWGEGTVRFYEKVK